jgi:hypothetical protein
VFRYFAYGSALDPGHFADWCRQHDYEGRAPTGGRAARLDGYELALTVPSRYWQGGVGTLVAREGAHVWGVLFELPDEDAAMIRHKEGVSSGLYREIEVSPAGEPTPASAFVSAQGRTIVGPPPPSRAWLEVVVRGAEARGLPAEWVEALRGR